MASPIRYAVDLSGHVQHLVRVRLTVPGEVAAGARVVLPAWTPGSYVIRNYVHHVQHVEAGGGARLRPDGASAWVVEDAGGDDVDVTLELYANELTVRTNHVDDHHALLIPPATFPAVAGCEDRRHEVTIDAPAGWRVWSLLPDEDGAFVADDYHHLVDSAFEAGDHREVAYAVQGVPHRFVWAGHGGRPDLDRVAADAAAIGGAAVDLFGGDLPVGRYTFLCTAWDQGAGGLEHRDGAVLLFPAHGFRDPDGYRRFQTLIAHEYLHLWNVKRLVPAALTRLDYERPVHTPSLWVAEGWTAYYDELLQVRAGLWDADRYLETLGELVARVLRRPGRRLQSLRSASHDAWVKFYVPDENTLNAGVSYYEHGAVVAWALDLLLRAARPDGDGLDEVLRLLWGRFGDGRGYEESDVEVAASDVAGRDVSDFFARHVAGVDDPPLDDLVAAVGLRFVEEAEGDAPAVPDLGVESREDDQGVTFAAVLRDRPAWRAGLTGGDRLLALDGVRVGRGQLDQALRGYAPGETVEVSVLRGPRLLTLPVVLGDPWPKRQLRPRPDATDEQRRAFRRWTGREWRAGKP